MKITVCGLWHLGCVTSACLASAGHQVIGLDEDKKVIKNLSQGKAPLFEPGLDNLIAEQLRKKNITFTDNAKDALLKAEIVWITYDTPVNDEDEADSNYVIKKVKRIFPLIQPSTIVIFSSQLPVGTIRKLKIEYEKRYRGVDAAFASVPENLRLGKAIDCFMNPDRFIVGVESKTAQIKIKRLINAWTKKIEWMNIESAEMTKHAINTFLAASVVFTNELAQICERVGAHASEVERGLKTEKRIGPYAYLSPGSAFAGGTLARDVQFLTSLSKDLKIDAPLLPSILSSNYAHQKWGIRKLNQILGPLSGKTITVFGLTYKPSTNTLRRSSSVEICRAIYKQKGRVRAFDPMISKLSRDLNFIKLKPDPYEAAHNADALLILTTHPQFKTINIQKICQKMRTPVILDPNRFFFNELKDNRSIRYYSVGHPSNA